jgi:hypothetical protein
MCLAVALQYWQWNLKICKFYKTSLNLPVENNVSKYELLSDYTKYREECKITLEEFNICS